MKILVTGGAGFIGSHLCDAYLSAGHQVYVVDDLSSGRLKNIQHLSGPHFHFEKMDILSADFHRYIANVKPDVINHHAAQKSVRDSVSNPKKDAELNVLGIIQVLEGARAAGCKKIIFASSGGVVYDDQLEPPFEETSALRPTSPYGITKLCSEYYLDFYSREYGFACTAFRYANVYGPRQDPLGEAGVVAIFSSQFIQNKGIVIYGTGEQTRDFIYVEDLAQLNLMAIDRLQAFQVFNVGTGKESSVNQLAKTLMSISQKELPIQYESARAGEAFRSVLNSSKLEKAWNWRSTTSIDQGLLKTFQWFQTQA